MSDTQRTINTKFWNEFKDFVNDHLPLAQSDMDIFQLASIPLMIGTTPEGSLEFYEKNAEKIKSQIPEMSRIELEKFEDNKRTKAGTSHIQTHRILLSNFRRDTWRRI